MPKRYWLFKTEEGCYPIDRLAAEINQTTHWDGVRNYQARNLLRDEIKKGDEGFFYHSSGKPTGIAGLVRVTRGGYPDHTAEDPSSDHPDPKHTKNSPIWYMVDVRLTRRFSEVIPLRQLKATPGLEEMMVTQRGSRLSVQPVRPKEWQIILKLARGL